MARPTVLVTDDDPPIREGLCDILEHEVYDTLEASDGKTALARLEQSDVDLLLLDLKMPRVPGMDVLRKTMDEHPTVPVVIVSGKGTIQKAVKATKIGAYDFLEKPVDAQRLLVTVRNALEKACLERQRDRLLDQARDQYRMVGTSEPMQRVYDRIDKAAASDCRVLITGESGTGKELVARAIHHNSDRAGERFVTVNCAALPEDLIESELFGHAEGAFTGAKGEHTGKFAQADGGTLFLDEIGDMSLAAQSKTLRAIETGTIHPIGSEETIDVNTAWWRRRTPTCRQRSRTMPSAKTSTTGSTSSPSRCRPSASGGRTSPTWPHISCPRRPGRRHRPSLGKTRSPCSCEIGRAHV